jgi:hypothetical protein
VELTLINFGGIGEQDGLVLYWYLNQEGCFCSPYSHSNSLHCGIYLFPKKGASGIVPWWGGAEFELLVEITNPVPEGALEAQGL